MDHQSTDLGVRARATLEQLDKHVEQITGKPSQAWASAARQTLSTHPLGAFAGAVALGYVLGAIARAGRSRA